MKQKGTLGQIFDFLINDAAPAVLEHISQAEKDDKILNGADVRLDDLEDRVAAIEERNRKVEIDKAWECSLTRKIVVGLLTYLVIGSFLAYRQVSDAWISALVPAVGFFLSTLTLPLFKKLWLVLQK